MRLAVRGKVGLSPHLNIFTLSLNIGEMQLSYGHSLFFPVISS